MSHKTDNRAIIDSEVLSGFLIIISFCLALCVANITHFAKMYNDLVFSPISFGYGNFIYQTSLISLVNDGLMSFFFLLIGLELKYHLVLGEYKERKTLALPTAAALGGIIIPALIYIYFNYNQETMKGWAIPIATDTAFVLGLLSFFRRGLTPALRAFIIGFSLIDDALALIILALFYSTSTVSVALLFDFLILALLISLNRANISNCFWYLILGAALWVGMVEAGIHGTLCGAILALLIPLQSRNRLNPSFKLLEDTLKPLVYYGLLPFFVFINSGISLSNFSTETITSSLGMGIILGLFIGKQLGIAGFAYLAIKLRLSKLPANITFGKIYAVATLGGIGFTLSLFIGDLTFKNDAVHYIMRASVIIGSLLSAFLGMLLFYQFTKNK